jgi:hypothetical protein
MSAWSENNGKLFSMIVQYGDCPGSSSQSLGMHILLIPWPIPGDGALQDAYSQRWRTEATIVA